MAIQKGLKVSVRAELAPLIETLKRYGAMRVILFGSLARGEEDEYSDVDLLIIKKTDKPFPDRLLEVVPYLSCTRGVETVVYTPEEYLEMQGSGSAFMRLVLEEGQVLYDATG